MATPLNFPEPNISNSHTNEKKIPHSKLQTIIFGISILHDIVSYSNQPPSFERNRFAPISWQIEIKSPRFARWKTHGNARLNWRIFARTHPGHHHFPGTIRDNVYGETAFDRNQKRLLESMKWWCIGGSYFKQQKIPRIINFQDQHSRMLVDVKTFRKKSISG